MSPAARPRACRRSPPHPRGKLRVWVRDPPPTRLRPAAAVRSPLVLEGLRRTPSARLGTGRRRGRPGVALLPRGQVSRGLGAGRPGRPFPPPSRRLPWTRGLDGALRLPSRPPPPPGSFRWGFFPRPPFAPPPATPAPPVAAPRPAAARGLGARVRGEEGEGPGRKGPFRGRGGLGWRLAAGGWPRRGFPHRHGPGSAEVFPACRGRGPWDASMTLDRARLAPSPPGT